MPDRSRLARLSCLLVVSVLVPAAGCAPRPADPIRLMPVDGRMMVNAVVPGLDGQVFGLGLPETIGSREQMWLVNHPDAVVRWVADREHGTVSTLWVREHQLRYSLALAPATDHVDFAMTIENLSDVTWHGVFAFNCISPAKAPGFKDASRARTYLSVQGRAVALADLPRVEGARPTVTVYPTTAHGARLPPFAAAFQATSPAPSDGSWMAVVSETSDAYMATTTPDAAFLFSNTQFGCIHAAPSFGDIDPRGTATVTSRAYFARGTLQAFLERLESGRDD